MKKDITIYLKDILESLRKIESYLKSISKERFFKDSKLQDAIIRRLEIIGEATKKLPKEFKEKHPEIEWKKISGIRDFLIHVYFGVNLERIWVTATKELPELKIKLRKIIKK